MLFCIGKPMMDIIVTVDEDFLKKYNLSPNCPTQATRKQAKIFSEIHLLNPKYVPGGSVTNTTRVFQWISQYKENVFYLGIIGKDNYSKQIKQQLANEKIDYLFYEALSETIQCAVLVSGNKRNRSLVSNSLLVPSNNNIMWPNLNIDKRFNDNITKCDYLYLPVYSLGLFPQQIRQIIDKFVQPNKKIIMNLGASYTLEKYADNARYLIQFANVVIGNEEEYHTLAKIININYSANNLDELLQTVNIIFDNIKDRILIVTRGSDSVVCLQNDQITYHNVETVVNIKDTTGAGDAFAGGFLAQLIKNQNLEKCVRCGIFCAREVIQHFGCDFDKRKSYNYKN